MTLSHFFPLSNAYRTPTRSDLSARLFAVMHSAMKDEGTQTKLKGILPSRSARVLYVDYPRGNGTACYRLACQLDLEGIVTKRAGSR